jgi:hypothetical protein
MWLDRLVLRTCRNREGTRSTIQNNTLAKFQWRSNQIIQPSDGKVLIELVASTYAISYNVLF